MEELDETGGATPDAREEELVSQASAAHDLDAGREGEGARIEGGQAPVTDAQVPAEDDGAVAEVAEEATAEVGGQVTAEVDGASSAEASNEPVADDRAPDADDAPALEALAAAVAGLDGRLAESQRLLVRQGELTDKLHAENQRLRAGELRGAMLPLVRDLLRLHDDIGRIADASEQAGDLELMQVSLLDALARNGIVPVRPAAGEPFDPKRHSAAGVVEADDPSLDRSISEVIRLGFQWEDGQVVRVADVRVYRHTSTARPSGPDCEAIPAAEAGSDNRTGQGSEAGPDAHAVPAHD
jgi:molecular chaperone GrpE (heat shock protein)